MSEQASGVARAREVGRVWACAALDLVVPAFCLECNAPTAGAPQAFFCTLCWQRWPVLTAGACRACGRPRERQIGYDPGPDFYCLDCGRKRRSLRYTWAAARYEGVARTAIRAFKYNRWDTLAPLLGPKLMEAAVARVELDAYAALVPVPLHWRRSWWRGFNQAALLAEHLTALPGAPPIRPLLKRKRHTPPQSRLAGRDRARNLADAFAVRKNADVKGHAFLLIDDVTTTGTTLKECARALRHAGATHVDALTLAASGTVRK